MGSNPVTGALTKREIWTLSHGEESHEKMEAEIGVMNL